jgi:DNA/RNA-binding domain of Phe-tRNA-synthetase-like protein
LCARQERFQFCQPRVSGTFPGHYAVRNEPGSGVTVLFLRGGIRAREAVTVTMTVAGEVCAAFPGLHIAAVVASGVRMDRDWPEVEAGLRQAEEAARLGQLPAGEDDPHIASWHAAYRAFGTNPRRQRPSADALRRRLARTGALPRINPAVDCYNLVSARCGVPAGAFDLGHVAGDIVIRLADGPEEFVPLGEPGTVEHPHPGEVIYTDAAGVLTRHWNHRDAERTKVTEASTEIVFLLETVEADRFGRLVEVASGELAALVAGHARSVRVHRLTAAHRSVPLQA